MKSALLKLGILQELDAVYETVAQRSARNVRAALQFTWATMTAYFAWRTYAAWEATQSVACAQTAVCSTALVLLPIGGVSVAIAHLNRRINGA